MIPLVQVDPRPGLRLSRGGPPGREPAVVGDQEARSAYMLASMSSRQPSASGMDLRIDTYSVPARWSMT